MDISPQTIELLDEALQNVCKQEDLPGITALISLRGQPIWSQSVGYADLASGRPAAKQTLYHLGSLTKIFTAIMLMQLRDAGRLNLDDPLEDFMPEFQATGLPAITLRQLVSHTAGLPLMPPLDLLTRGMQEFPPKLETLENMTFPSIEEILAVLPRVDLESQPGTQSFYSNLGIALLARALETAAGQEYTDYVQSRILEPLGMRQSGFSEQVLGRQDAAVCYLPFFSPPVAAPPATKLIAGFTPTGALWSSAEDMAGFLALLTAPEQEDTQPVLSKASLLEMLEMQASLRVSRYTGVQRKAGVGIGWFLSEAGGYLLAEHGGADPSTSAYLAWIHDQHLGLFIASNTGKNPQALAETGVNLLEWAMEDLGEPT